MERELTAPEAETLYETLQVSPHADAEVIEAAYRVLARRYHPDLNPSPDATALMAQINAAWETLRQPELRAAYDRGRGTLISTDRSTSSEPAVPQSAVTSLVVQPDRVSLGPLRQGTRRYVTAGVYTEPRGIRVEVAVATGADWLAVRPALLQGLNQERITLDVRTRRLRAGAHRGTVELRTSWETRTVPVEVEVVAASFFVRLAALMRHGPSGAGWRPSTVALALACVALFLIVAGLVVVAVGR